MTLAQKQRLAVLAKMGVGPIAPPAERAAPRTEIKESIGGPPPVDRRAILLERERRMREQEEKQREEEEKLLEEKRKKKQVKFSGISRLGPVMPREDDIPQFLPAPAQEPEPRRYRDGMASALGKAPEGEASEEEEDGQDRKRVPQEEQQRQLKQQQLQQQQLQLQQQQQEQELQEQLLQQQEQMLQQQLQPMAQSSGEGRELGTVEKFAPKRGFGLIQPDNGGDSIFAHWTQICSHDKWPQLSVGMRVEFTRVFEKGRPAAKSIMMPGGGVVVAVEELMKNGRKLSPFTVCGTVAWFHRAGYGFIKLDTEMEWPQRMRAGQQVYVSREDLIVAEGSPCALEEGQRVQFKVFKPTDHNDVAAAEVTAEDGSPIVVTPTAITNARGWQRPPAIGTIIPTNLRLVPAKRELERDDDADDVAEEPASKIRRLLQSGEVDLASMQAEQVHSIFGDASQQQHQQQQQDPSKVRKFFGQTDEQLLQDLQRTIAAGEYSSSRGGSLASVPCKFHAQGRCARGASCPFSHRADLALALASSMPPGDPPTRKVPCRFFSQGRCQKGEKCQFAHNSETPQPVPLEKKVPIECEYFAQARCTRAEACPFAHGPQELHEITILQALRNPGGFQPPGELNTRAARTL